MEHWKHTTTETMRKHKKLGTGNNTESILLETQNT